MCHGGGYAGVRKTLLDGPAYILPIFRRLIVETRLMIFNLTFLVIIMRIGKSKNENQTAVSFSFSPNRKGRPYRTFVD